MPKTRFSPVILALSLALTSCRGRSEPAAGAAPIARPASQFHDLIVSLSEEGEDHGEVENVWSNEDSLLDGLEGLPRAAPGEVYVGVGPEQTFTNLVYLRPQTAFVVDIRRDNLLLHLLYRRLFVAAASRQEFLRLLLSRRAGDAATPAAGASEPLEPMVTRLLRAPPDQETVAEGIRQAIEEAKSALGTAYKPADEERLARLVQLFSRQTVGPHPEDPDPSLAEILLLRGRRGQLGGFLATEEGFQWLRAMQTARQIIPLVGDLRGGRAMEGLAAHLRARGERVGDLYASNVEQFFGQPGDWAGWKRAALALPRSDQARLLRSCLENSRGCGIQIRMGRRTASFTLPLVTVEQVASFSDLTSLAASAGPRPPGLPPPR